MTYQPAEVHLPSWPAPYTVRTSRGPYGATACACQGGCGGRCTDLAPLGGVGALPGAGVSAVSLLAVAAGGFLLYKYVFQNKTKARASALRAATRRYKAQRAAIRARYA